MNAAELNRGALGFPATAVVPIDRERIDAAVAASRTHPRGRIILPLHRQEDDLLQRMLNAIQPGSYIRPHRHASARGESLILLRGALLYFVFDEGGRLMDRLRLQAGSAAFGVDIEGGVWHTFAALEADTVLFEVKPGPYDARVDKEFAQWAPVEGAPEAAAYLDALVSEGARN